MNLAEMTIGLLASFALMGLAISFFIVGAGYLLGWNEYV